MRNTIGILSAMGWGLGLLGAIVALVLVGYAVAIGLLVGLFLYQLALMGWLWRLDVGQRDALRHQETVKLLYGIYQRLGAHRD